MRKLASLLVLVCSLIVAPSGRAADSSAETNLLNARCSLCHTSLGVYETDGARLQELVGRVKDRYPKYDEKLNRYQSMEERLSSMIVTKLGGTPPTAGDQRLSDLAFYLKTLR